MTCLCRKNPKMAAILDEHIKIHEAHIAEKQKTNVANANASTITDEWRIIKWMEITIRKR